MRNIFDMTSSNTRTTSTNTSISKSGTHPDISISTFNSITPRPSGGDIPISTTIQGGASAAKLVYRINYEDERSLKMNQGVSAADGNGKESYSATIPASDATPGSMVCNDFKFKFIPFYVLNKIYFLFLLSTPSIKS